MSEKKPAHQPYIKWFPTDWRADPRLRMCSLAARGLWIELIGYMHEGEPYGYLTINGVSPAIKDMAALVGRPIAEVRKALAELEQHQVFSVDDGRMYSRRMVRDKAKALKDHLNGKGGGNPDLIDKDKGGVNPPDKAQSPEARDQKPKPEISEADASGADAPIDHRKRLFSEGLQKLATMTGKGPDACRSFVGKCLKASSDDAIVVLGLIEDAERNQVVDPGAWISARLKPRETTNGRRTIHDAANEQLAKIRAFDADPPSGIRGGTGETPVRLLSSG